MTLMNNLEPLRKTEFTDMADQVAYSSTWPATTAAT